MTGSIGERAPLPVACSLDGGAMEERGRMLRRDLFAAATARLDLADGMSYRFPGTDECRDKLLAFAATERTCCAFFRIELAFEPGLGPIWLTLRGPHGAKAFVQATFEGTPPGDAADAETGVPQIARDELKALLDGGAPVAVVETLPEPDYRRAHLPGSLHLPVERIDDLAPVLLPDKRAAVVVYCANLACPTSALAARRLLALGYANVREYAAGKQDWIDAGYPTERGRGV